MNARGFTLVELILYVALLGLITTALVSYVLSISQSRSKIFVAQEVNTNMRNGLSRIEREIRRSGGVNIASSTFGVDPGILSLQMAAAEENPTVFSLTEDNGQLQIQQGSDMPIVLMDDSVRIDSLLFTNLTASSSRESIQVVIDASYIGEAEHAYDTRATSTFTARR